MHPIGLPTHTTISDLRLSLFYFLSSLTYEVGHFSKVLQKVHDSKLASFDAHSFVLLINT